MINFDEIAAVEIPEFNGGTGITKGNMFIDENGKIMKATLEKGSSIGEHTHIDSSEIVYIINGTAKCILNGAEETVTAGQCHYCPKGSTHTILNENDETLIMFCVVPKQ